MNELDALQTAVGLATKRVSYLKKCIFWYRVAVIFLCIVLVITLIFSQISINHPQKEKTAEVKVSFEKSLNLLQISNMKADIKPPTVKRRKLSYA